VALLVAVALTGAGAIVYLIESQRIEQQISDRVDQQFEELARFQADERTGGTFDNVRGLLRGFLRSKVPDENETLVTWYDGGVQEVSVEPGIDATTPRFKAAADAVATRNGSTSIVQDGDTLLLNAQTVRVDSGGDAGALIVVTYLTETRQGLRDTMQTYAIVALLSLFLITALAWAQSGRLLAPLRTLRETAEEITDTDLSRRLPVTGNDDITALTRTVNGMLDRLEEAFVGQRRFLDDAGHELKTPLTVLRGHLELLDTGSPVEVAETKALLLDEVDRMARLVGDLILLAKRDRPDFVTPAPVDLTGLTVDVLAKARGLGDRTWVLDETASVSVLVDEQRLTQALLQLCDNAVKHTHPGQVVALGSSYDSGQARLWVRDTGPGVPPEHRDHIFQRFGRGIVPAHDEGFGLGLSIVHAIADAHDGTVHVEDADPHGARFVITLPLAGTPATDDLPVLGPQTDDQTDAHEELSLWQGS
jgi:two-component system OmpR family sensor kinase